MIKQLWLPLLMFGIGTAFGAVCMIGGSSKQSQEDLAQAQRWAAESQSRAAACESQFKSATVLYEPGPEPSIPFLHGVFSVQANAPVPSQPKWFIPAKIQPYVGPGSTGFVYGYLNQETRKMDGPYLPRTVADAQQGPPEGTH